MKKWPRKYKLHKYDFYEDDKGNIIRYGKGIGIYYQINDRCLRWFGYMRNVRFLPVTETEIKTYAKA